LFLLTELTRTKAPNHPSIRHFSVITCDCGFEILVLTDLKAMSQAIKEHVLEHKNKGAKADEVNRIEEDLLLNFLRKLLNQKSKLLSKY